MERYHYCIKELIFASSVYHDPLVYDKKLFEMAQKQPAFVQ